MFTLGLIYLLYVRRADLIRLFFRSEDPLPAIDPGILKWVARLLAIGGAFTLIFSAVKRFPHSPIEGKWTVDQLIRNRDTVTADAWLANSGAWRTVYFERFNQVHLCPNPYVYDRARSLDAGYSFDSVKHRIQLYFPAQNSNDTATEAVTGYDGTHMNWEGMLGGDTIKLRLSRAMK